MSDFVGEGSVAQSNPIAAANKEKLMAKEKARREAAIAEHIRQEELALQERNRKREEARLEKEARIAQQIKERTAALEADMAREEREKAKRDAEEAARREAEEKARLAAEKEAALAEQRRLEQEEKARQDAIAAERAAREAQKRASEQRRMEQLRQAEREAEQIAEMLALQRKVEDAIFMAVTAGALSNSESTDLRLKLRGSSKADKEKILAEVEQRMETLRPRRQSIPKPVNGEEEVFLGFGEDAIAEEGGDDGPGLSASEDEEDGNEENTPEKLKQEATIQAAKQVLLKHIAAKDIVARLADPATADEAIMSLLRFLSKELAMGKAYFLKRLSEGSLGLKLEDTLGPLKATVQKNIGHTPAIMCLGLMAFSGNAGLYKRVCELDVIPSNSNQWIGTVLGCRLYHEYITWLERSKVNTALPWTVGAEKEFGKIPGKTKDKSGREKQRAAANAKVQDLIAAYGLLDGPSPDVKEAEHTSIIILKFDIIASSLDGIAKSIKGQLTKSEEKVAQAVKEQLSDDGERRARQALGDARGEVTQAEAGLRRAQADAASIENQIAEAEKRVAAAEKRQAALKKELEGAEAQVKAEEAKKK